MGETRKANIWELSDLCTPWCVHVAATLRIANHIDDGKASIHDLAAAAGCDQNVLHSVLGHLVSKGVFEEPRPGSFALNEAAQELLDPIVILSMDLDGLGGRFAHAWGSLLQYTRTGIPAYADIFGLPFFEDLRAHPQIAADFNTLIGPAGHGTPDPHFEVKGGWEPIRMVADVGGGTGAMLAEILRAHPHVKGMLVDLPETVASSAEIFQSAGVTARVTAFGQSFFDPLPTGADIYLLRGIVNDWPDRETVTILRRCAEAARAAANRSDGRVVILKSVTPDDTPRDLMIEMVLLGGKQRTLTEFRGLAHQAGLEVISATQQIPPGKTEGGYFVVECRPV